MDQPKIAGVSPAVIEIEPGTYHWCRCGRSENQPFCDGSHAGTGFEPMEFVVTEHKKVALCRCKQTGKPPFCDGKHKSLVKTGT